jgi:hypothetical protein
VWMFGITAGEVLTRRYPYPDTPASQYIALLISKQLDPAAQLSSEFEDAEIGALLRDCLCFEADARPTFERICARLDA